MWGLFTQLLYFLWSVLAISFPFCSLLPPSLFLESKHLGLFWGWGERRRNGHWSEAVTVYNLSNALQSNVVVRFEYPKATYTKFVLCFYHKRLRYLKLTFLKIQQLLQTAIGILNSWIVLHYLAVLKIYRKYLSP